MTCLLIEASLERAPSSVHCLRTMWAQLALLLLALVVPVAAAFAPAVVQPQTRTIIGARKAGNRRAITRASMARVGKCWEAETMSGSLLDAAFHDGGITEVEVPSTADEKKKKKGGGCCPCCPPDCACCLNGCACPDGCGCNSV